MLDRGQLILSSSLRDIALPVQVFDFDSGFQQRDPLGHSTCLRQSTNAPKRSTLVMHAKVISQGSSRTLPA